MNKVQCNFSLLQIVIVMFCEYVITLKYIVDTTMNSFIIDECKMRDLLHNCIIKFSINNFVVFVEEHR